MNTSGTSGWFWKARIEIHFCFEDELHSITEKFMEYQAHHGNEVAEE